MLGFFVTFPISSLILPFTSWSLPSVLSCVLGFIIFSCVVASSLSICLPSGHLGYGFRFKRRLHLHEFLEQGTVVNHRRPKIFSACFSPPQPQCDGVRGPVIFYNFRVVDRNVRGALIEIGYGIAASLH